ncbi:uncharacterized membrane protein YgdD (TMEM256/DUF423 family) [Flavobacteriaceae bacterium MAR_2010_72]|nr:uncharacterized membrane protein YgdD (TMEM256/DUF423 family) [Flavobacteriaceae bacterium MAR_2010_72]TVZ58027.1 uncharacterized membrane protein YgdD (TMEM256/DUF423 family) [Flavobacteriaceae bacterium MAR_2010_105]
MNKLLLVAASILGVTAVILGAFAAHGLKALISLESQQVFETGVRHQMYHALVLLFVGSTPLFSVKTKRYVLYLMVFGVLFFSGSIYALATNELSSFDFKSIGFITPIGGLLLIMSWVVMLVNFIKLKRDN